jgi:hypothetical protein
MNWWKEDSRGLVKAFKIFHQKHPDALLLTLWGNKWPQITKDLIQTPRAKILS